MTIEEIKKLKEEATPGKWHIEGNFVCSERNEAITFNAYLLGAEKRNIDFIVALPQIADECIRLAEENDKLHSVIKNHACKAAQEREELLEELEGMIAKKDEDLLKEEPGGQVRFAYTVQIAALEDVKDLINKRV